VQIVGKVDRQDIAAPAVAVVEAYDGLLGQRQLIELAIPG
jgi:hypothetical protein